MTGDPRQTGQASKRFPNARHNATLRAACLVLSLSTWAHPALAQSAGAEELGPLDVIDLSVTGWSALRGGAAEAALLSNSFTIDSAGMLELPIIGKVQAAGLSEQDLAKLIDDRLQERSGFQERAIARVHRRLLAVGSIPSERDMVSEQRPATSSCSDRSGTTPARHWRLNAKAEMGKHASMLN
jgi:protein involved in polysaccharide export with SLBB domain